MVSRRIDGTPINGIISLSQPHNEHGGKQMVKFNKHNVTNTQTKAKCRVHYSLDNRCDGRRCVTVYSKCCLESLRPVFGGIVVNNSESQSDYYENDRVVLFDDHPLYVQARRFVESMRGVAAV